MSTIYLTYPEAVRHEIARRLQAADEQRQRRLARQPFTGRRSRVGAGAALAGR